MRLAAFCRAYAITLRPYLFFVSGTAGLVGLAAAPPMPLAVFGAAFLAFFMSYGLGQALTDVFQTDTDALSSPYRPLVRGEIEPGAVLSVSLAGLVLCGAALAAANPGNTVLAAAAVAGLLAYTPLKRRWWGGPPCNAAVMALLPVMGFLCGEPSLSRTFADGRVAAASASVFASYAVFVLLGYLKDVDADRATGYRTLPVRFGRRAAVRVSAAHGAVAVACSLVLLLRGVPRVSLASLPGLALWLAGVALLVLAHARALSVRTDREAYPAIGLSVRSFLALHLGEAALLRTDLLLLALPLLVLYEAVFALRPCREQI